MKDGAISPMSSEWTSVRISPGEDAAGQNVLAVRVLVTSEDSRYAQASAGGGSSRVGEGQQLGSGLPSTGLQRGLSGSQFPHLSNGDNPRTCLRGSCKGQRIKLCKVCRTVPSA